MDSSAPVPASANGGNRTALSPDVTERSAPTTRPLGPRYDGLALRLAFLGMATLGFNRARVSGLAVSDLLFLACAAVIAVKLLVGDGRGLARPASRRSSPLILTGSMVLLTFGTLSTFGSWDPLGSMQVVARFAWLTLIWFWILRSVARDRDALHRLLYGWRIAILVSSFFAVIGQLGIYQAGRLEGENRQMAFFFHPNELASLLVFGLPLMVFDVPRRPGQPASTVRRVALTAFVAYAITTTGSMTAFLTAVVGLVASAVAIPATRGRLRLRRHTGFVSIGLATLAIIGLAVAANSELPVFQRFTRFQEGDSGIEGSIGTRAQMNDAVIASLDETLFVGTGMQLQGDQNTSNVARVGEGGVAPGVVEGVHNMYLKLVHEGGVPALVGLLIVVVAALQQAWRTAMASRGTDLYPVAVALLASIVASNAMAQFGPIGYQRYYWAPVAMATCLWSVRRHELRVERATQLGVAPPGADETTQGGSAWRSRG